MRLRPRQIWGGGVLVATLGLLALIALSAEEAPFDVKDDTDPLRVPSLASVLAVAFVGFLLVAAVMFVLSARRVTGQGAQVRRQRSLRNTLAAIAIALALVPLLRSLGTRDKTRQEVDESTSATVVDAPREEAHDESGPPWAAIVLGLGVVVVLGMAAAMGKQLVDKPPPADAPVDPDRVAAASVARSLDVLALTGEDRAAIVAAYATLLDGLATAGLPRHRAEAPEEYLSRVLAASHVTPAPLRELTALFAEARFSEHPMGPPERARAVAALEAARADMVAFA